MYNSCVLLRKTAIMKKLAYFVWGEKVKRTENKHLDIAVKNIDFHPTPGHIQIVNSKRDRWPYQISTLKPQELVTKLRTWGARKERYNLWKTTLSIKFPIS